VPQAELTIDEAASWLDPPVTARQLRIFARELGIGPSGQRKSHLPGRPAATYDARELMALHSALAPWLARRVS